MVDEIGAHVKNMNKSSIGVCYIGGVEKDGKTPKDTRTIEQKESMLNLLLFLKNVFPMQPFMDTMSFLVKRVQALM